MQFNLSILGAMLAASSSVLAAPTTPQVESPSAAIQQVVTLSASFQKEIQGFSDPAQIGQVRSFLCYPLLPSDNVI